MANYTYGVGGNILWDHANIDPPTHRWIAREFGWVPITFFRQMSRCATAGHLVAASGFDELPEDAVASAPRSRPRWTFLAGAANRCFLARSQERSFAWLDALEPGRHALVEVPGYTHLDLFFGRDAERDVFGHIRDALLRGTSDPGGVRVGAEGSLWKPPHRMHRQGSAASRRTARCCACAATTSSSRSSGWATTRLSAPSTTATASACSPIRARCSAARAGRRGRAQDVFLRAYGALRHDDRPVTLRAWLYRVAHNRCIDHLRRPEPPAAEVFELSRAPAHDPSDETERREDLRRLVQDVQRLPEQQRSALLMRELDGLSYAELADALDTSVPAIKSLLVRARIGLVEAGEARDTACVDIRADLDLAHGRGVRASSRSRRHLRDCDGCRDYRQRCAARARGARGPRRRRSRPRPSCSGSGAPRRAPRGAGGSAAAVGGATAATATATNFVACVLRRRRGAPDRRGRAADPRGARRGTPDAQQVGRGHRGRGDEGRQARARAAQRMAVLAAAVAVAHVPARPAGRAPPRS